MITLTPHLTDYKNKKDVIADLESGKKDFILNNVLSVWHGKPCLPKDLAGHDVEVRYNKLQRVFIYSIPEA